MFVSGSVVDQGLHHQRIFVSTSINSDRNADFAAEALERILLHDEHVAQDQNEILPPQLLLASSIELHPQLSEIGELSEHPLSLDVVQFVELENVVDDDEDVEIDADGVGDENEEREEGNRIPVAARDIPATDSDRGGGGRGRIDATVVAAAVLGRHAGELFHDGGPIVGGCDLDEREDRVSGVLEVVVRPQRLVRIRCVDVCGAEELRRGDAEDVEDEDDEDGHVEDLRQGVDERLEEAVDAAGALDGAENAEHADHADDVDPGARVAEGDEGADGDEDVEDVVGVVEERAGEERGEGDDDFEGEEDGEEEIFVVQEGLPKGAHAFVFRGHEGDVDEDGDGDGEFEQVADLFARLIIFEVQATAQFSESVERHRRRIGQRRRLGETEVPDPLFLLGCQELVSFLIRQPHLVRVLFLEEIQQSTNEEIVEEEVSDDCEEDEVDDRDRVPRLLDQPDAVVGGRIDGVPHDLHPSFVPEDENTREESVRRVVVVVEGSDPTARNDCG